MREKSVDFFGYGMHFSFISPSFSKGPLSDGCAICFVARGSPKAATSPQFAWISGNDSNTAALSAAFFLAFYLGLQ